MTKSTVSSKEDMKSKTAGGPLQELGGYRVLPVHFDGCEAIHYLYLRRHSDQKAHPLTPADRTLFLLNLPTFTTEKTIKQLFKGFGRVSQVWFQGTLGNDIFHRQAEEQNLLKMAQQEQDKDTDTYRTKNKKKKRKDADADNEENLGESFDPIALRRLQRMGSYAHVVFLEKAELDRVLDMPTKRQIIMWPTVDDENTTEDPTS